MYKTSGAFRQALLTRLSQQAEQEGTDVNRLIKQVAFDRFLARLFYTGQERWVLKGGYALELRLKDKSRSTKDLDLNIPPPPLEDLLEALQEVAELDLNDFFDFRVRRAKNELVGPPLGGYRFHIETSLDNKRFSSFPIDLGQGDVTLKRAERIEINKLSFAGLKPSSITIYPLEDHFADKVHAYTTPRENPSRVKDLIDMLLIIGLGLEPTTEVKKSIVQTFIRYERHDLPKELPKPPKNWQAPFAVLARELDLNDDISKAYETIQSFLGELERL